MRQPGPLLGKQEWGLCSVAIISLLSLIVTQSFHLTLSSLLLLLESSQFQAVITQSLRVLFPLVLFFFQSGETGKQTGVFSIEEKKTGIFN